MVYVAQHLIFRVVVRLVVFFQYFVVSDFLTTIEIWLTFNVSNLLVSWMAFIRRFVLELSSWGLSFRLNKASAKVVDSFWIEIILKSSAKIVPSRRFCHNNKHLCASRCFEGWWSAKIVNLFQRRSVRHLWNVSVTAANFLFCAA